MSWVAASWGVFFVPYLAKALVLVAATASALLWMMDTYVDSLHRSRLHIIYVGALSCLTVSLWSSNVPSKQ